VGGDPFADTGFLIKELERINEKVRLEDLTLKTAPTLPAAK
jgi:hypothetical protein